MWLQFGFQDPIDGQLRGQILVPVHQRLRDLARRQAGKLLAIGRGQNFGTFIRAQLVGRRPMLGTYALVDTAGAAVTRPARVGANADVEHLTHHRVPASAVDILFNQGRHQLAIRDGG
jgi:hypothetical protein